jgi:hypothetical protein
MGWKSWSIWERDGWTGVEANGMVEITSKWIVQKSLHYTNSEYIFRKGSDPMAGMKCSTAIVIIHWL